MGGGGDYNDDVAKSARSSHEEHFEAVTQEVAKILKISPMQNPKKLKRECRDIPDLRPLTTPIVVCADITLTRRKDLKILFEKLPMFIGQIFQHQYAPDPEISFAAVGDATYGDKFPIQIGEFEAGNILDDSLKAIIIEEGGGGGTGQESYQLMAYFYAYHAELDCLKRGQKGKFFFIGDEGFYPKVLKKEVLEVFGEKIDGDLDSAEVFKKLQEKFDVFFIYSLKPWEEEKQGIDAEIRDRVEKAGGMFEGVDIRASLSWNNRNDLDLHCITPDGFHIYYGTKRAPCSGELDVDRNVNGETTKPVENTRWAKGKAKKGRYHFYVENYRFHESSQAGTPFRVELEVNGEIQHFDLKTPGQATGESSRVEVAKFDYDPLKRSLPDEVKDNYAAYNPAVVKAQWAKVIPEAHIIPITEAKAVVDAMLGILAVTGGTRKLEEYIKDMKDRDQSEERQQVIRQGLANLAIAYGLEQVSFHAPTPTNDNDGGPTTIQRL